MFITRKQRALHRLWAQVVAAWQGRQLQPWFARDLRKAESEEPHLDGAAWAAPYQQRKRGR